MTRILTFAAGLIVVIASGVVYGAWTQRWQKSADLEARAAKLRDLPDEFGRWKGRPAELDAESLALAGAEGWWVRRFTDERSGTTLLVILLCGRPGPLSVHKPETCYGAAGFEVEAPPVKYTPAGAAPDRVLDRQVQAGRSRAVASCASSGPGTATAAGARPTTRAGTSPILPALYKLYVIRETGGRTTTLDNDPAADFLRRLLPEASRVLSQP